jgi:outer membrane lipoprotein-sorting protein
VFAQVNYLEESEKKAKAILEKTIQALGGERFLQAKDITVSGRFYEFRKDELAGTTVFQSYTKFPNKFRNEIGKKKEVVIINDGEKGWKIEYKNLSTQSPEEIKSYIQNTRHSLDYVFRFLLKEEGSKLRYAGVSRMDLDSAEEVQLIDKDNDRIRIFISSSTFLPLKMGFQSPGMGKRWATEDEKFYYNYHNIQGVQVPFKTVRMSNGFKVSEVHLESATLDSGLPDGLFTPEHVKK